jgi:DeoR family suf operon transcriptional repressor
MSVPLPIPRQNDASGRSETAAGTSVLAPTREAALAVLLREGEETAAGLAERLGVSVQVMRRHLRTLQMDGLVEASPTAAGPGRPSNRWRLTERGRGRFPDGSDDFALGLLQSMAASLPAETMRLLMEQQAADKAADYRRRIGPGSLRQRLQRLVDLRREEGYVAELHPDAGSDGSGDPANGWVIREYHCSVIRIAQEFPMVCDQELQLICNTFPDCRVERIHWRLQSGHSCGFRLLPRSTAD